MFIRVRYSVSRRPVSQAVSLPVMIDRVRDGEMLGRSSDSLNPFVAESRTKPLNRHNHKILPALTLYASVALGRRIILCPPPVCFRLKRPSVVTNRSIRWRVQCVCHARHVACLNRIVDSHLVEWILFLPVAHKLSVIGLFLQ